MSTKEATKTLFFFFLSKQSQYLCASSIAATSILQDQLLLRKVPASEAERNLVSTVGYC